MESWASSFHKAKRVQHVPFTNGTIEEVDLDNPLYLTGKWATHTDLVPSIH